ncbi:lema family protein [Variovorax sp. LT1R16]|uniref:lema family protein n=1 Tax=Variovorax sp. LT1R16 TaxID=3443728 RepID=UPI003F480936
MLSRLPPLLPYWIGAAILLFWFVGAYNRLMRLRSAALQAYAALDAALLRQLDFVQAHLQAQALKEGEGAASPAVASLRASTLQLTTLLTATRLRPLDPAGMAALDTALYVMLTGWQRLYPDAVNSFEVDGTLSRRQPLPDTPSGPDAGATTVAAEHAVAWPEPSATAEIARHQFNLAVQQYNSAVGQFPALLVAWVMQLRRAATMK